MESRDERERTGLFYVEGMRFVHRALETRFFPVESLIVCPELLTHPFGRRLLDLAREYRTPEGNRLPVQTISERAFRAASRVEEPQGIGAVVRQHWERLHRCPADAGLCWLVLDTVRAPGNLGTILRAMDAVGGTGLILLGRDIDPYAPDVVRATMGSLFALRYARATWAEFTRWREKQGVTLVGTSPHATDEYRAVAYPERLALWLGGERQGMSEEAMTACDQMVTIPMVGSADSLNIALSAGILLYEVFHQRRKTLSP